MPSIACAGLPVIWIARINHDVFICQTIFHDEVQFAFIKNDIDIFNRVYDVHCKLFFNLLVSNGLPGRGAFSPCFKHQGLLFPPDRNTLFARKLSVSNQTE